VTQPGDDARLPLESRAPRRIVGNICRQHLDGDVAIQPGVARAIHLAHPAFAEQGDNLIRTEARADVTRHREPSIRNRIARRAEPLETARPWSVGRTWPT